MKYSPLIPVFQLSIRAALAAGLAVAIAEFLRLQYPLYALVGAVIVSDPSPSKTWQLGFQRVAGSVVGAMVGAAISHFLPSAPWAIGLSVLIAMSLSPLLRLSSAGKISGYVCGIVVLGHSDHPWSYALYRLIETSLGVGMAALVSFVPKLIPVGESKPPAP